MLMTALKHALDYARRYRGSLEGTIFEFGVASGITYMQLVSTILQGRLPVNLVGFDSFEGLPAESSEVWCPAWHSKGEHAFGQNHVNDKLANAGLANDPRFQLVPGFFDKSLKESLALNLRNRVNHLLLVNIDVDLHISTIQLLDYCLPVMQPGTVLYFDDWKDPRYSNPTPWGEHRAWDEWNAANPNIKTETIKVGVANERYLMVKEI